MGQAITQRYIIGSLSSNGGNAVMSPRVEFEQIPPFLNYTDDESLRQHHCTRHRYLFEQATPIHSSLIVMGFCFTILLLILLIYVFFSEKLEVFSLHLVLNLTRNCPASQFFGKSDNKYCVS